MAKPKKKDPAAVSLGRKGGKARWKKVSPEERARIAKRMVEERIKKLGQARWIRVPPEAVVSEDVTSDERSRVAKAMVTARMKKYGQSRRVKLPPEETPKE